MCRSDSPGRVGDGQYARVDEHAARVVSSLERLIADYRAETASEQELQYAVSSVASALDHRYADLVSLLNTVDSELETAIYAMPAAQARTFTLGRCDQMADAIARAFRCR